MRRSAPFWDQAHDTYSEAPTSRQEEVAALQQMADELRRQLSEVVGRLEELEKD